MKRPSKFTADRCPRHRKIRKWSRDDPLGISLPFPQHNYPFYPSRVRHSTCNCPPAKVDLNLLAISSRCIFFELEIISFLFFLLLFFPRDFLSDFDGRLVKCPPTRGRIRRSWKTKYTCLCLAYKFLQQFHHREISNKFIFHEWHL